MKGIRDKFSRGAPPEPRGSEGRGEKLVQAWRGMIDETAEKMLVS